MTPVLIISLLMIPIAYMVGSITSAVLICQLFNLPDPRKSGSKNPGTTNVMRLGGKIPAACTLLFDLLKGLIPVLIAKLLQLDNIVVALTAVAAFLGHLYPLFFQFKGGKGVATAFGAILGLNYLVAFSAFGIWLLVFSITRISSLSALTAALLAPFFLYLFNTSLPVIIAVIFMDILLIIKHKSNIKRLLKKEEEKLEDGKKHSS